MRDNTYYLAEDCPNCGQKDSHGAWKGARMGSTSWGHPYMCCSEKCGLEYANSPKRWRREIEQVDSEIKGLRDQRREFVKCLTQSES